MDLKDKQIRNLTRSSTLNDLGQFTPDGKSVIYTSNDRSLFRLYRVGIDGSNPKELVDNLRSVQDLRIAQNGQFMVFSAAENLHNVWDVHF